MCPVAAPATNSPTATQGSAQNSPAIPSARPAAGDAPTFAAALRGYERSQVDEFVVQKAKEMARLRMELADAQRERRQATEHAEATEAELRELRARTVGAEPSVPADSFGYRAEKLLRM